VWSEYRLKGEGEVKNSLGLLESAEPGGLKAEVEVARQRISRAAGVSPEAVKITVEFGR
jgi:hypothetical protein